MSEASSSERSGRRIRFMELTLRQLGHMETDLTFEEKLLFLQQLDRIGVDRTMVWGLDHDAEDLVRGAADLGLGIEISWFGKVYFEEELKAVLNRAATLGVPVALQGRGADFALEVSGWTRQTMLDTSLDAVKRAKDKGLEVTIGLSYSTQTDSGFLREYAAAVEAVGADRLKISDSLGVSSPETIGVLVGSIVASVEIPVQVHCHNDFGLATANAIACAENGAESIDVVVNGFDPERSGIVALDEIAVALELLYGYETGIQLADLTTLSRLHEQMTGMRVPDSKPIVGRRAFNYRVAEGAVGSAPKRDQFYGSEKVVPFDPALVGNSRLFMIGRFSGRNEVAKQLAELGLSISADELDVVLALVTSRGAAKQRAVTDDELRYFVEVACVATAAPVLR